MSSILKGLHLDKFFFILLFVIFSEIMYLEIEWLLFQMLKSKYLLNTFKYGN